MVTLQGTNISPKNGILKMGYVNSLEGSSCPDIFGGLAHPDDSMTLNTEAYEHQSASGTFSLPISCEDLVALLGHQ